MPLLPFRLKHDIRFNANSSKIFFFLFEQIFWGGFFGLIFGGGEFVGSSARRLARSFLREVLKVHLQSGHLAQVEP
jgi:hypothetical protein